MGPGSRPGRRCWACSTYVRNVRTLSPSLRGALATKIPWGWIAAKSEARLRLLKPLNLETTMLLDHPSDGPAAIHTQFGAIFVSLELSRSNWLITSLSPGKGEKMSQHSVTAGNVPELLKLFADLKRKAEVRTGQSYPIITIQEAGLVLAAPRPATGGDREPRGRSRFDRHAAA